MPDSFSDGGQFDCIEQAVEHALHMQQRGADIIFRQYSNKRKGRRNAKNAKMLQVRLLRG
jgi:dihydropteroate synthase